MGFWGTALLVALLIGVGGASYASYRRHARRAAEASRAAHARLAMELELAMQERDRLAAEGASGVEVGELSQEPDAGGVV